MLTLKTTSAGKKIRSAEKPISGEKRGKMKFTGKKRENEEKRKEKGKKEKTKVKKEKN
ncbi:hypothetical protein [Methanosarcina lacustris]|uniref:hypothetical protein n=1 Tax=Methanosarcina lacustris TaxID=170861 RepID=UPI0012F683D8|nr:hypothetical protein [Methanosarcina lacustris]